MAHSYVSPCDWLFHKSPEEYFLDFAWNYAANIVFPVEILEKFCMKLDVCFEDLEQQMTTPKKVGFVIHFRVQIVQSLFY